jgi:hypothetical protein
LDQQPAAGELGYEDEIVLPVVLGNQRDAFNGHDVRNHGDIAQLEVLMEIREKAGAGTSVERLDINVMEEPIGHDRLALRGE